MYNIFHIDGGIGKNIMGTGVLRNICNKFPENKTIVVSAYPEVFLHNPRIYRWFKSGVCPYFYDDYVKNKNSKVFKIDPYSSPGYISKKEHLTESWCKIFGLVQDSRAPELYFNTLEEADLYILSEKFNLKKPVIIVQTNGGMGYNETHAKFHWFRDIPTIYFQTIIDLYKDSFHFVHFRAPFQQQLNNTIVTNLTLRESLNFLRIASGAICIDSMVQHAMAALGKKSMVCWVGNKPEIFGYKMHTNIISNFKDNLENAEAYLEPQFLNAEGYQCPANYDGQTLFNPDQLISEFEKLFVKK